MFLSVNCSGGLLVVFSLSFFFFNILNIESSWKHCRLQRVCLRSRPCLYIRLSAAAEHWDRCVHSICMRGVEVCACAPACVCVSVREGARETRKKTENGGESCIVRTLHLHVFSPRVAWAGRGGSRCWDLLASLGRECKDPRTLPLLPANELTAAHTQPRMQFSLPWTRLCAHTQLHPRTTSIRALPRGSLCAPLANR